MIILGVETSCDETGIGLVRSGKIEANLIASQEKIHAAYGGVVPELASRQHLEKIDVLFKKALDSAGVSPRDINAVGVTDRPGLKGSLIVGVSFACGLACSLGIPLYRINHLYAHLAPNFIENPEFPSLGFVISGGHTTLFAMKSPVDFRVIGRTLDDACGETFDKVGRMLGLGFPGGPNVEREALKGDEGRIPFPVPLLSKSSFDFSFSGLKTSVLYHVKANGTGNNIPDICAGFQKSVGDVLVKKAERAIKKFRPKSFLLGGGVIQNRYLRDRFASMSEKFGVKMFIPGKNLCLDNGAMVAVMTGIMIESGGKPGAREIKVVPT